MRLTITIKSIILRFNERLLRELNAEQEDVTFRQRASRLQKWRLAAQEAQGEEFSNMKMPDTLQTLECACLQ